MVSHWSSWHLIIFFLTSKSHAYIWCASGYTGSNIYLFGKNSYFKGYDNTEQYFYSSAVPFQSDRNVYIWQNSTDKCYTFLTLPDGGKSANIPIPEMTIHATCTECSTSIDSPELCPSWYISNEGIDDTFGIIDDGCEADNWIINSTLETPQNQPPDICMYNTDQYRADFNDLNFVLFSLDRNGNPYYYDKMKMQYITQYEDSDYSKWYWIQYKTVPSSLKQSNAFCMISAYPNESIIDCVSWYYQNSANTSQYLPYNLSIDDHDCSFPNDNICVYDSTLPYETFNKDINGEYTLYTDSSDYDGFKGGSRGISYIRFIDNAWQIGYNQDLDEYIFSTCNNNIANTPIDPFDITSCNGYWQLPNTACCDTLTISNTLCENRPTRSPTLMPTTAPSISPTTPPSIAPSFSPTCAPSISPTTPPSSNPTYIPTLYPSQTPTVSPSAVPTLSPTLPTETPTFSVITFSTDMTINHPIATDKMTLWQDLKNSDNFVLSILVLAAIGFLCISITIAMYCCIRRRNLKKIATRREQHEQMQKEHEILREQITLDVTEHFTEAVEKVSTEVTKAVAKTTKEVLLESIHGSYMGSPSPTKRTMNDYIQHLPQPGSHNKRRLHSYPMHMRMQQHHDTHNMRHLSANYHPYPPVPDHRHLSPNTAINHVPSSTVPLSSPEYDAPSIIYNKSSPYDRSAAVLSPDRHNSYRDSTDSNNNAQFRFYDTQRNEEMLHEQHALHGQDDNEYQDENQDNVSVNYLDAEIEEKENRLSSNRHKQRIHKQYGIAQPDVFPDDGDDEGAETHDNEGYLDTQSVAYNNVNQVENRLVINVENDEDKGDIEMIISVDCKKEKASHIAMNTEEFGILMEKVMLDKSFSDNTELEENDRLGPLNGADRDHLSPIVVVNKSSKRKSTSEMSASQTGKSFMSLMNEMKQIEISQDIEDDGLEDDEDDEEDDEQIESSPLLSLHNAQEEKEEEEDVDIEYEHKQLQYNISMSSITDETEEYHAPSQGFPMHPALMGNRKNAHNAIPSESQTSFEINNYGGIENPFKIVDPDEESFTNTVQDDATTVSEFN